MIPRVIEDLVISRLEQSRKVILLLGARQVGKTTMVKNIEGRYKKRGKRVLYLNCDIEEEKAVINTTSRAVIEQLIANSDILLIDEAQGLDNPGLTLKNLYAIAPHVQILATGSSSFELKNRLSDPLTGRFFDFLLYPLSFEEAFAPATAVANPVLLQGKANALLPTALLYGFYPEVFVESNPSEKQAMLRRLVESYLFRDVLTFQRVKNAQAIKDLTRALAYQIGSEVNENELATRLKIDRKTVISYLDVLEKSYVIVRVQPFSKNPRREIGRNYKIYFVDLGIRNALIGDFNSVELRADAGSLWENFLVIERMKAFANRSQERSHYFWRNYGGAEVDYIEHAVNQKPCAFEFKYGTGVLSKGAQSFTREYGSIVKLINQENYVDFILGK